MTGRRIARDESRGKWLILVIMWAVLLTQILFDATARGVGVHLLAACVAPLWFLVLSWKWGLRGLALNEWLLVPTAGALLATVDVEALQGSVVSYAGLAALLAPFVRHLARIGSA